MKHPQVINLLDDSVMAFSADNVIDDTTQDEIDGGTYPTISVDLNLYDLMTNAPVAISSITMTYRSLSDFWTIDIADVSSMLTDRHKYVGTVSEDGATANMRNFKVLEFAVDNDGLEDTLMRLPYQIEIGGTSDFVWYNVGQLGVGGQERYTAPAYEGGTGTTYATDPSRVTHRGAVVPI
jgi:hypothetical protein